MKSRISDTQLESFNRLKKLLIVPVKDAVDTELVRCQDFRKRYFRRVVGKMIGIYFKQLVEHKLMDGVNR